MQCPRCGGGMQEREGKFGAFWGCRNYPRCKGTRQSTRVDASRLKQGPVSVEQAAGLAVLLEGRANLMMPARAGVGKSHFIRQAIIGIGLDCAAHRKPVPAIGATSFNRHIAEALNEGFRREGISYAHAFTFNSIGNGIVLHSFPDAELFRDKLPNMVAELYPVEDGDAVRAAVVDLCRFCKYWVNDGTDPEFLSELISRHAIDIGEVTEPDDVDARLELIFMLVPRVLAACAAQVSVYDYDDQIWLPLVRKLPMPRQFDLLFIDEAQDTNRAQKELAMRLCPKGRIVVVGDAGQAISAWRGADDKALGSLREACAARPGGVEERVLTVCRRCPKKALRLAQVIVPDIRWMTKERDGVEAPEGEVYEVSVDQAASLMAPGDLVLCRVNKDLVPVAYKLIRRGLKPVIKGRQIGQGLEQLVKRMRVKGVPELLTKLSGWYDREVAKAKAMGKKGEKALEAVNDKYATVVALCEGMSTTVELLARIDSIFSDDDVRNAVTLGTIHRTKGLEANNVFILSPHLLPHPMATQEWEVEQENNVCYVAVTRVMFTMKDDTLVHPGRLYFCGNVPKVYQPDRITLDRLML